MHSNVSKIHGDNVFSFIVQMYKYGRTDFIETNLKPALVEGHQHHMTFIETARVDFERHLRRLLVVRQEKQKTWLDLMGMCVCVRVRAGNFFCPVLVFLANFAMDIAKFATKMVQN